MAVCLGPGRPGPGGGAEGELRAGLDGEWWWRASERRAAPGQAVRGDLRGRGRRDPSHDQRQVRRPLHRRAEPTHPRPRRCLPGARHQDHSLQVPEVDVIVGVGGGLGIIISQLHVCIQLCVFVVSSPVSIYPLKYKFSGLKNKPHDPKVDERNKGIRRN